MIRANTRGRLTAADLQLVILLLSRGSAAPAGLSGAAAGDGGARLRCSMRPICSSGC